MADFEGIKAKIRALRARTVENGCTEAEALAAAGKVMELLARRGLAAGDEEIAEEDVALGLRANPGLDVLWPSIAWVCHCELLHITGRDRPWVRYVGRDPWPEAASYLHEVVSGAARRALLDFRQTGAYRRHYRSAAKLVAEHHFQEGFAAGLVDKLRRLKQARDEAAEQRQDLAMASQAVSRMATSTHQARGVRGGASYRDARARGQAAGQAAHVGWGLGQAGPAGLLGGRGRG